MDNHFFEQILANAQSKKNAEQKIKAEVLKQSKEVLRDYAKPILEFLFLINEKYVFNKNTEYKCDKVFIQHEHSKEKFESDIEKNTNISISIVKLDATIDYIHIGIKDDLVCYIKVSNNTVRNFKDFVSVEEFFSYIAEQVVKHGELKQ